MPIYDLPGLLKKKFGWKKLSKIPRFFDAYKWRPKFVFIDRKANLYIAADIIFNQQFPERIYRSEVNKVVHKNRRLRVCLFTSAKYQYNNLKKFCVKNDFGLKIYTNISVNTIVPFPSEKVEGVSLVQKAKEGWFPRTILDNLKNIKKIKFKDLIIDLAGKLEKNSGKNKKLGFVCKFIDDMLASHPKFLGSSIPFMKLSNFENLLNFSDIVCRDHTFHSARVFLIGCVIIDHFYDKFISYYKNILGAHKINIEYMWLITALFHDIGRIKQEAHRIFLSDPSRENPVINDGIEEEMRKRWKENEYIISLGNVVELVKQSSRSAGQRDLPFVGYALGGAIDSKIAYVFQENYNKRKSHGVIGCFDLSADLLRKMQATQYQNKPFLLYHMFPALVAIALHDWKLWKELAELKIFPINFHDFPLAALLIYIDTWDDYKRDQDDEKITINDFSIAGNTVTVDLTWHKINDYLEEKFKYESFKRNVITSDIKLEIVVSNVKSAQ